MDDVSPAGRGLGSQFAATTPPRAFFLTSQPRRCLGRTCFARLESLICGPVQLPVSVVAGVESYSSGVVGGWSPVFNTLRSTPFPATNERDPPFPCPPIKIAAYPAAALPGRPRLCVSSRASRAGFPRLSCGPPRAPAEPRPSVCDSSPRFPAYTPPRPLIPGISRSSPARRLRAPPDLSPISRSPAVPPAETWRECAEARSRRKCGCYGYE